MQYLTADPPCAAAGRTDASRCRQRGRGAGRLPCSKARQTGTGSARSPAELSGGQAPGSPPCGTSGDSGEAVWGQKAECTAGQEGSGQVRVDAGGLRASPLFLYCRACKKPHVTPAKIYMIHIWTGIQL